MNAILIVKPIYSDLKSESDIFISIASMGNRDKTLITINVIIANRIGDRFLIRFIFCYKTMIYDNNLYKEKILLSLRQVLDKK